MTPERWKIAEEIIIAAWDLPEESRAAFLREQCGHDAELLSDVRSLVEARVKADCWTAPEPFRAPSARRFGAYQLERMIGRGGMGAVYLAHRVDGAFEQKVAVKVVGLPFDIEPLRERFRQERQILANLNHPNITHLIDGGVTDDGELYVAMEYVDGLPLDEYVRRNDLSEAKRLDLFRQVANTVAYAHQNLIVHRDLKPSNILVTSSGVPKLLDFGTAKLLHSEAAAELTGTNTGFLTVAYASPEQLRGKGASTLGDVYSLGAILYELVSGERLFANDLVERLEKVPNLKLPRHAAGDLNLIVRKALDPEPSRRYSSVEQLSEDVRRYEVGEPVTAHPPALTYRVGKFLRRNAWTSAIAAVLVLGLAATTVISLRQRRLAIEQAELARRESARSRRLAKFTNETLLSVSPNVNSTLSGLPSVPSVIDLLDNAAKRAGPQLSSDPDSEVEMLGTIGAAYNHLGLTTKAEPLVDRALAVARTLGPGYENQLARALWHKCSVTQFRDDLPSARRYCQEALDTLKRASNPDLTLFASVAHDLAFMMFYVGAPLEDVERMYQLSADRREQLEGRNAHWCLAILRVGELRTRAGDLDGAERILREALDRMRALPGPPVEIVEAYRAMAALERNRGRYGAAAERLKQALAVLDKKPAAFYSRTQFETELMYAQTLSGQAADVVPRARTLSRKVETDPEIRARLSMVLGLALAKSARAAEAKPMLVEAAAFFGKLPENRAVEKREALAALAAAND